MKKKLVGAAFFITVSLVMFLIGEFVLRALYADQTTLFPRYHTDAQYGEYIIRRIRPNSTFWHKSVDGRWKFTTNSRGFRNATEFNYEKDPGTLRVLSLGDSHTQGYEVRQEHTFSAIIEKYLKKHGISAEVINAGVSGFGTAEELVLLENEGLKYKPDVIVLGFYRNDFEDNIKSGLFRVDENGILVASKTTHIPGVRIQNAIYAVPGVKWLGENSYFYSLMFNTTWELFKKRLARQSSAEVITEYAVPQQDAFDDYETSLAAALLERMYRVCNENKIKLIIVDVPVNVRDGEEIGSSFSDQFQSIPKKFSDAYLDSSSLLADYAGVAELHRPHGHGHISEITHAHIGLEAAKAIVGFHSTTLESEADSTF